MNVYCITNTVNGKRYIGITKYSLQRRFTQHCRANPKARTAISSAIAKYGKEVFEIELLEVVPDRVEALSVELDYIKRYRTHVFGHGYNLSLGGQGALGVPRSEESKRRMAASAQARMNRPDGRAAVMAACEKMLAASRTPETRAIRNAAIKAAYQDVALRELQGRSLTSAAAALRAATTKRMVSLCGEMHLVGYNLRVNPSGQKSCRACDSRRQRETKLRRFARAVA